MGNNLLRALATALPLAACAVGPPAATLIGDDIDSVRERLGPPLAIRGSQDAMLLTYRDRSGAAIGIAVIVIDDVVVRMASDLVRNEAGDVGTSLLGADIASAVAVLGPVENISFGTSGQQVELAGRQTHVSGGRIIGIRRS